MSLQFIAIPDGFVDDGGIRLRVLIVPHLSPPNLDSAGLANLPALLAAAKFQVITKTPQGTQFASAATLLSSSERDVWQAFFGGKAAGIVPLDLPTYPAPSVAPTFLDARHVLATAQAVTTSADTNAEIMTQLQRWVGPPTTAPIDADQPVQAVLDFHRSVSMLREHAVVLESLGLILTLRADAPTAPEVGNTLSVRPTAAAPVLNNLAVSPWTRYEFGPGLFRPAPSPDSTSGVRAGMLDVSSAQKITPPSGDDDAPTAMPSWALVTFDVDNATQGLRQAAARLAKSTAAGQTPQVSAPVVRSMGLGLLRPGRATELATRTQNASPPGGSTGGTAVLSADDLILGYRVDIKTGDGPWLPLCERDANYTVTAVPVATDNDSGSSNGSNDNTAPPSSPVTIAGGVHREEGHVKPFAAIKSGDDLHTDEFIVRWQGWGLALPVIKLAVDPNPPPAITGEQPYIFEWTFTPPAGRLPTLRFATDYRMRVRIADMSGGGVGFTDPPDATPEASPPVTYTRYDPIPSPLLQSDLASFGTGAAIDRMVIRSNPDGSVISGPTYAATEARRIAAPPARLALVEQHAYLDGRTDEQSWSLVQRAMADPQDADAAGLVDPAADGVTAVIGQAPGGLSTELLRRAPWTPAWPDPHPKTVTLASEPAPADPHSDESIAMDWSADALTLAVTLGIAKQAVVQLSSPMTTDLQTHFEATSWLAESPQSAPQLAATLAGRNAAVSPVRPVLCVNAVRCPLADPQWSLSPQSIQRDPLQTSVLLNPRFTDNPPQPGLNTDSTGRLEVAAAWTDTADNGPHAGAVTTGGSATRLFTTTIDLGPPPDLSIRHEFGDTKHRTVSYTLNAVTRFRQYFADTDDESLFHRARVQDPVQILSSARPAPLTVLGAVPAFAWLPPQIGADRIDHVRQGGRIRVEVARPWFSTGEGELLAVLSPSPIATPADRDPYTRMGRDPLFGAPATPLYPSSFTGTAAAARTVALPELTSGSVTVLPYTVSPADDRWYADIVMAPDAVSDFYNPFIQLAVARYQPFSLPNQALELSPPALTDMVALLPDRYLTVTYSGAAVTVTLTGAGPQPANPVVATLEQASGFNPDDQIDLVSTGRDTGGVPAWVPVAEVTGVLGSALPPLALPTTATTALRVRVLEHEALQSMSPPSGPAELGRRTVFVDTLDLPDTWH
jgi:hypothetical protein